MGNVGFGFKYFTTEKEEDTVVGRPLCGIGISDSMPPSLKVYFDISKIHIFASGDTGANVTI